VLNSEEQTEYLENGGCAAAESDRFSCSVLNNLFGVMSATAYCDTDNVSNHISCVEKVLDVLFE